MSRSTRRNSAIERIRSLAPVCGGNDHDLERVDRLTYEVLRARGTIVVAEGDSPQGFFLIVSGRVELSVGGHPCGELGPGMFFGEAAMLDRGREPLTVTTLSPTVLRVAGRREFQHLIRSDHVAHAILLTLARRQRAALTKTNDASILLYANQ